jgi:hypothetical protein
MECTRIAKLMYHHVAALPFQKYGADLREHAFPVLYACDTTGLLHYTVISTPTTAVSKSVYKEN